MTPTLVDPATRRYQTLNPATGEVVATYDTAGDERAEQLLASAHAAYLTWRETPLEERIRLFFKFADLFDTRVDLLARQVSIEMGKPLEQSVGEAGLVSAMFRYYAEHAPELLADEAVSIPGFNSVTIRRESVGVVLGIEPWNGPLYQAMRATAPNLMLGNTVLIKPSEICAGSTLMFDELFTQAGFPADVYQTALVSADQVSSYIADERLRAVTLTGSDRAGSAVGEQAGRHIKPVILELGGSDAFIVLDSADVSKAAGVAAFCRTYLGGQICVSPKRMIVTESVADQFIAAVAGAVALEKIGDPFDPETTVGPLSSEAAVATLQAQYQDAIDKGETVVVPGGRMDGPGSFFKPAMITDITPDMRVYSEEAFGPLVMVYRVADARAAVTLANSSSYGLGGTVFAEDLDEAQRVAAAMDTGMVGINGWLGAPIEIPFGGTKRSGVGRELGRSGMDVFANIKTYGVV